MLVVSMCNSQAKQVFRSGVLGSFIATLVVLEPMGFGTIARSDTPPRLPETFIDSQFHWAAACIDRVGAQQKFMKGDADRKFHPDRTLNRAQFAALIMQFFPNVVGIDPKFSDIPPNHWAKSDITRAYSLGLMTGYPNNLFKPNQPITKVEALTILANSQPLAIPSNPEAILTKAYRDASEIPSYARGAIAAATLAQLVTNHPNIQQLRPNRPLSRGEAAALLCQDHARSLNTVSLVPKQHIVQIQPDKPAPLVQSSLTLLHELPEQNSPLLLDQQAIAAGKLFFISNLANNLANSDALLGRELWATEGSLAGKRLGILPPRRKASIAFDQNGPQLLGTIGNRVWLAIDRLNPSSGLGYELWQSDGTEAGTGAIASLDPALKQQLSNAQSVQAFRSPGSADTNPPSSSPNPSKTKISLPFIITTREDIQLWQIVAGADSPTAVTQNLLKQFEQPTLGSQFVPQLLGQLETPQSTQLFFSATTNGVRELWRSDGTLAGTIALHPDLWPQSFKSWKNRGYLQANSQEGLEWWTTDGTPAGTLLLKDIYPGRDGSEPRLLTGLGDRFFALANSPEGLELWATQGSPATTKLVKQLVRRDSPALLPGPEYSSLAVHKNKLFFSVYNPKNTSTYDLWASDGTEQGTQRLAQLGNPGAQELTVFRDRLFFSASGRDGQELWVSDGTPQGTRLFIDLAPGTTTSPPPCVAPSLTIPSPDCGPPITSPNSSSPSALMVHGNGLYFIADQRLYRTDGTVAGTKTVKIPGGVSLDNRIVRLDTSKPSQHLLLTGRDVKRDRIRHQSHVQIWALP